MIAGDFRLILSIACFYQFLYPRRFIRVQCRTVIVVYLDQLGIGMLPFGSLLILSIACFYQFLCPDTSSGFSALQSSWSRLISSESACFRLDLFSFFRSRAFTNSSALDTSSGISAELSLRYILISSASAYRAFAAAARSSFFRAFAAARSSFFRAFAAARSSFFRAYAATRCSSFESQVESSPPQFLLSH